MRGLESLIVAEMTQSFVDISSISIFRSLKSISNSTWTVIGSIKIGIYLDKRAFEL